MCPAQELAFLFDDVVVWLSAGVNRDNEEVILTPYQINARWDNNLRQMRDTTGKLVNTDVVAFVDEDIPMGSIMWLGIFQDLPNPVTDLFKVISINSTDDIRNVDETTRELGLVRYKNVLPQIIGTS
jgi:hypothetical protein